MRASPALMRSDRRMFSCFAMVAMMEITASLKMPVESKYCSQIVRQGDPDHALVNSRRRWWVRRGAS